MISSKNIAIIDNSNTALGQTIVNLKGKNGLFFSAEISPLRSVNLALFPDDEIKNILKFNQFYMGSSRDGENPYLDAIKTLQNGSTAFYTLNSLDVEKPLIYGYAGFKRNDRSKCLEIAYLYKSYHFAKNTDYDIAGVGHSLVGYGVFLNDQTYGNDTEYSLIASPIKWNAKPFYDKMKFKRGGLWWLTALLPRQAAKEKFHF